MSKLDKNGVLRLTMADLRFGVSFEAATVADVSGHREEIRAARCVCLTSAEGERRIIGGRAECLRLDTRPETDARSAMTLAQIVNELNEASGPNVKYRSVGDSTITFEIYQEGYKATGDSARLNKHRSFVGKKCER